MRGRALGAGHDVAVQYRELLQAVLHVITSRPAAVSDARQALPPISRKIAQCVTELVTAAELLKGNINNFFFNYIFDHFFISVLD